MNFCLYIFLSRFLILPLHDKNTFFGKNFCSFLFGRSVFEIFCAFYNMDAKNLMFAKNTGSGWEVETVDSTGDVGDFCCLALGNNGCFYNSYYNSYYDRTNGDLKMAKFRAP